MEITRLIRANLSYFYLLYPQSAADAAKLNRKESYKAQRKNYRREKKRVASELMNSLQDPAVIVLADWLKVSQEILEALPILFHFSLFIP